MIRVNNKGAIARLSRSSLKANHSRNLIAISAIILTTLLFTALFTISGTIVNSYQQQTFRQSGSDFHGVFKKVTEEQMAMLAGDPMIEGIGRRLMLGMPSDPPFNKEHVEVSYMDEVCAKGLFCTPEHGSLPEEGTEQIACDERILQLLGVEPRIGARITLAYYVGKDSGSQRLVTRDFVLSGWWAHDAASAASHAVVPLSYARQVLAGYERQSEDDLTGRWDMYVYLPGSMHIDEDLQSILAKHGWQANDPQADSYITTGVNWAYIGAQFSNTADLQTVLAMVILLALIVLTGYLIIYNIFYISVSNDIRFYGLLKTIGATSRQIRWIVLRQALFLSAAGIPIGLFLGYIGGIALAPAVMSTLSYKHAFTTAHPLIFAGGALFTLFTVLISCVRPAILAARVSPVEAVRYTENAYTNKTGKKGGDRLTMPGMAWQNLGRNRRKTLLVGISLALGVALLQVTCIFTGGFDMDKYLRNKVVADFIVGNEGYFRHYGSPSKGEPVPETVIADINTHGGISDAGRIYGLSGVAREYVTEAWYREYYGQWNATETLDLRLEHAERNTEGLVASDVQLYGMESFPLDHLNVVAGDLSGLYDPSQNAIAAVYHTDDYGVPEPDTHRARVGDKVTLGYVDAWENYDIRSGLKVEDGRGIDQRFLSCRPAAVHYATYTVAACVTMRNAMSFRYYSSEEYVLNSGVFQRDTGSSGVMTYMFDAADGTRDDMEQFLADYTRNQEPTLDYESRQSYVEQFNGVRAMFLLTGGALSGIIGLVGILNFLNAILTSILARRREFAMLQAIGMTGRQLQTMLIWEGALYTVLAAGLSLGLCLAAGPLLDAAMSSMFWFFTYNFTILPVLAALFLFLLLGMILPPITYRCAVRQTIIERLREAEL